MDSKSFRNRIIPMAEKIYPMVARMLGGTENAEDAIQEIMMKLWKDRKKVGDHPNAQALVFRTARNHCIDVYRRNKMQVVSLEERILESNISFDHDLTEWKELNDIIRRILKDFPENQSEVLMLRDLDGLEFDEIAEIMNLKIENVRMLLSRARKKMREKLLTVYNYEQR